MHYNVLGPLAFALEGKKNCPDIVSNDSWDFIGHGKFGSAIVWSPTVICSPAMIFA